MNCLILYLDPSDLHIPYESVCGKTLLERSVTAGHEALQVQRICVLAPVSHKRFIFGNTFSPSLLNVSTGLGSKKIDFEFYQEGVSKSQAVYDVCVKYGIDTFGVMKGTSFLMPPWFIDDAYFLSFKERDVVSVSEGYFSLEVYPFARFARELFDDTGLRKLEIDPPTPSKLDISYTSKNKEFLEKVVSEMSLGLGLLDILEMIDGGGPGLGNDS